MLSWWCIPSAPVPSLAPRFGVKFSSKTILALPHNSVGWMRGTHTLREASGAEQGRGTGTSLKNCFGKIIIFLQILKFTLGNMFSYWVS